MARPRKCDCNEFTCFICRTRNYKRKALGLPLEIKEDGLKDEKLDSILDKEANEWIDKHLEETRRQSTSFLKKHLWKK